MIVEDIVMLANLIPLDMVDFDVVLGSVEEVNVVRHFPDVFVMICLGYHLLDRWSLPVICCQVRVLYL